MGYDDNLENRSSRSVYQIAEKNRMAKYKFLTNSAESKFQRGSSTRRSLPAVRREPIDLTIPGTPVCSRYVMSLKTRQQLPISDSSDDDEVDQSTINGKDKLHDFLESMEKLRTGINGVDKNSEIKIDYVNDVKNVKISKRTVSESQNFFEKSGNCVDFIGPHKLTRQNSGDDFFTRTYSRRVSIDKTYEPAKPVENQQKKTDVVKSNISYYKQTSLKRSVSNSDKFNSIVDKFKNSK